MNPDLRLAAIAARQLSVFSVVQARGVGFTDAMMKSRRKSGRWGRMHPGVFRLAGSQPSWDQALFAAWLAAGEGAVVSHRAAAAVAGFPVRAQEPELTVPRARRPRLRDVRVHYTDHLDRIDTRESGLLVVTTPTRTLLDLCTVLDINDLVEVFDYVFAHRLSSPGHARRRHDALPHQGRPGARTVALMLERYPEGQGAPDPGAERRLLALLSRIPGLQVVPQQPIRLRNGVTIHVDAGLPGPRVAIELQSYRFHSGLAAHARDNERAIEVSAAGWIWFPVTPWDVDHRPDWVLDRLFRVAGVEAVTDSVVKRPFTSQLRPFGAEAS